MMDRSKIALKILSIARIIIGIILLLSSILLCNVTLRGASFNLLTWSLFVFLVTLCGVLGVIASIGIIMRRNRARLIMVVILLILIPVCLYGQKTTIAGIFYPEYLETVTAGGHSLIVSHIHSYLIETVIFHLAMISFVFFLIHPKVKKQFK